MLVSAPALAADVAADEAVVTAADEQQPANLGTIDVHGQVQKREPESPEYVAPLVDTPRAVTIIPEQIITQTAATSLEDLLRTSPGITFGAGEGGQPLAERPFIRGQSSANNIFVDGVRDTGGQSREVFNLEQVEVIKGPDSVYSGRGSGGGSINLGSKAPRLTDFVNVGAAVGTDDYYRATIDGNWRFSETTAFRLNLLATQGDVPNRNAVDFEKYGLAMAFATGLGTDTTATLSYYRLRSDSMPDYGIPLDRKLNNSWAIQTTDSRILNVPYDTFYGLKARDYLRNEVDSVTLKLEHRFSENLAIRNVTRYSETLNDYVVTNPGDGGTAVLIDGERIALSPQRIDGVQQAGDVLAGLDRSDEQHVGPRADAVARLRRALDEYRVVGVKTTTPFFQWLTTQPEFLESRFDTTYLDQLLATEFLSHR